MEYPKTKITLNVRRGILILFIVAFFIITPVILLYTEGYRYDWQNGLLKETGAISVDIQPANAEIFLNNIKIKNKMPIRLKNITPRKYRVKITSVGYYDWERDIEVKNKQTVYIKEISLLKKTEPELLLSSTAKTLSLSPDKNFLAYTTPGGDLHLYNFTDKVDKKVINLKNLNSTLVVWAPKGNYFFVSELEAPYANVWIFNAENTKKGFNLTDTVKMAITKLQWKDSVEPELFFSTKNNLSTFRPLTQSVISMASTTKIIDWYADSGQFWTIQSTPSSSSQIIIINDTLGFNNNFKIVDLNTNSELKNITLFYAHGNYALIKTGNQSDLLLITPNKDFALTGDKFKISEYNDWLITWTPWEVWTYAPGEEPNLLNRSGEGLKNVLPLDKYNTLGLVWNEKTTILYPYYQVNLDWLKQSASVVAVDPQNKILYFDAKIGEKTGVWKLNY